MNRASTGRAAKIQAVDDSYAARADLSEVMAPDRFVNSERERWLRQHIRKERSSAYWFAAAKWGMVGMVAGMMFGGFGMYVATMGNLEIAQNALERAALMEQVKRESAETATPTGLAQPPR